MSWNDSISEHEEYGGETPEPGEAETVAQTQNGRRNPVHYTDNQIVKMIGATATANPYAAPHRQKKHAWNTEVKECNDSGLFQFEVTEKGLRDKITSLLNSLEKPRKTTQSRNYNSEIDNLRTLRQDAETKKESVSARRFEKAQRQEREGQIARDAALQTWRESQAERKQSPDDNRPPSDSDSPGPPREQSPSPQTERAGRQCSRNSQATAPNQRADPSSARFERMHGNITASTELLQGISEQLGELKAIGEETNALLRAVIPQPPPPVFVHSHPHHGPGPSTQARAQKRQRTESPNRE